MKKILLIVVVVAVVVIVVDFVAPALKERAGNKNSEQNAASVAATSGNAPGGSGMGGPGGRRGNPMDALKNEEGQVVLSKLEESKMPDDFKTAMKEADADGDGLLNEEEQKAFGEKMREMRDPLNQLKNEEGKFDLSKLADAKMRDQTKEAVQKADADGDGFLSEEEVKAFRDSMPRGPGMGGPGGPGMGGPGGPGMGGPGGPGMGGPGGPGMGEAPAPPADGVTPAAPEAPAAE